MKGTEKSKEYEESNELNRSDKSGWSDESDRSDSIDESNRLIQKHGGYRKLRSWRAAQMTYDATVVFCDRFIDRHSRTHDQMVQAARSGVRNIEEGSVFSGTSKKLELKLTNAARASLEELMRDCEDFLRHRALSVWDKESKQARKVRVKLADDRTDGSDVCNLMKKGPPELAANTLLCLINQASYLLHKQLERLERDFIENGGFTERMHTVRIDARERGSGRTGKTQNSINVPTCPICKKPMKLRTSRRGPQTGSRFWGCTGYPDCKGTRREDGTPKTKSKGLEGS
jgi:restriction system protein